MEENKLLPLGSLESVYKASLEPPLYKATDSQVGEVIQQVLVMIGASDVNYPPENQEKIIVDQVRQHFSSFTPGEIILAFSLVISGAVYFDNLEIKLYNQRFSVAFMTPIMMRFKAYKMSLQRGKAKDGADAVQDVNEATKRQIMISGVKRVYREFCKDGSFNDLGGAVFRFLKHQGLINVDKDTEDMALEAANRQQQNLSKRADNATSLEQRRTMVRMFETFDVRSAAERETQRLSLYFFLDNLMENGSTTEDIDKLFNNDPCPECGYPYPEHRHGCKEYYNGRENSNV